MKKLQFLFWNHSKFKLTLTEKIRSKAHLELSLDLETEVCYTEKNNADMKCTCNDREKFQHQLKQIRQMQGGDTIEVHIDAQRYPGS